MDKRVLPTALVVLALVVAGGLLFLWYQPAEKEDLFVGVGVVVPEGGPYVVLQDSEGGTVSAPIFDGDTEVPTRTVVLYAQGAVQTRDDHYVVPLRIDDASASSRLFIGFFKTGEENSILYDSAVFLGEGDAFPSLELRNGPGVVARYTTADGKLSITYLTASRNFLLYGYTIQNGDIGDAFINTPAPGATVATDVLTVSGGARGSWYFEGNLPVTLLADDGMVLSQAGASASGEWMTEGVVPFSVTLSVPGSYQGLAWIRLSRDNPSGLTEHDASVTIPIFVE